MCPSIFVNRVVILTVTSGLECRAWTSCVLRIACSIDYLRRVGSSLSLSKMCAIPTTFLNVISWLYAIVQKIPIKIWIQNIVITYWMLTLRHGNISTLLTLRERKPPVVDAFPSRSAKSLIFLFVLALTSRWTNSRYSRDYIGLDAYVISL